MALQLLTTASRIDWGDWLRGIVGAAISGGAGAVGSFFGTTTIAPKTFNVQHPVKLFEAMIVSFAISGFISLAKYLQMHPLPDAKP